MLTNLIAFDLKNSARLLVPLHIALLSSPFSGGSR